MNKFYIIFLLITSTKSFAQSQLETISYINTLLRLSTYNPKFPGLTTTYDNVFDSINVDIHGRMECVRSLTDAKSGKTSYVTQFYTYLKAIKIGQKKDYSDHFSVSLECSNFQSCLGGIGNERQDVLFSVTTYSDREKLLKAFAHLLILSRDNKEFYEKDPFGN